MAGIIFCILLLWIFSWSAIRVSTFSDKNYQELVKKAFLDEDTDSE